MRVAKPSLIWDGFIPNVYKHITLWFNGFIQMIYCPFIGVLKLIPCSYCFDASKQDVAIETIGKSSCVAIYTIATQNWCGNTTYGN
jgi:hypothetical protein